MPDETCESEKCCMLMDSEYAAGMTIGWNFAQSSNYEGFEKVRSARMHGAKIKTAQGPITHADLEAAFAAGAEAMREMAAELVTGNVINFNTGLLMQVDPALAKHPDVTRGAYSAAIRALPLPTMATSDCPRKDRT